MSTSDYGARFLPKESIAGILADFQPGKKVRVAGRVMSWTWESTFSDLKDEGGGFRPTPRKTYWERKITRRSRG